MFNKRTIFKLAVLGLIFLFAFSSISNVISSVAYADNDVIGPQILSNSPITAQNDRKISQSELTQQQKNNDMNRNFLFENPIEQYIAASENNAKAYIDQGIYSEFQNTPKQLWHQSYVRLIVTYEPNTPSVKYALTNYYHANFLNYLRVAYVTTSLDNVMDIINLPGVSGIYLDRYYQFLDPDWSQPSSQTATYPSEAYVGARMLLELGIDGSGMKIAILDTGIDSSHPDLDDFDNNPATNDPKVIAEETFVDYNFDGISEGNTNDGFGHGTHCAGIAAANGTLVGIAPGAYLMNGKVLDNSGWAYVSWVVNGIEWAVANGADVISMSLGWMPGDVEQLLNEAANNAWESGVMVVVAAGNSGPMQGTVSSPGMASRAITVGASDIFNHTTYWSSRGPSINGHIDPDIIAPGDAILSTVPRNAYDIYSGTSMATPAVAGIVALLKAAYPSTDIDLIRSALISTATDTGEHIFVQGAGLVNAYAAYEYLQNPSVFAYPSFSESSPLVLSPNERFSYQFDVFVNQSYSQLTLELSTNLQPYVTASFVDDPTLSGWIRADIDVVMSSEEITGEIYVKNGSTILYTAPLVLAPDEEANDAGTKADAGEVLEGAINLNIDQDYSGELTSNDYKDIYAFPVVQDQSYQVTLSQLTGDVDILVLDENGTIIGFSFNWYFEDEEFNFTALTSGNYYAVVIPFDIGAYHISVTQIPPSPSAPVVLTGNFNDYGEDNDSDGLYDYIVIETEVEVSVAGEYDFIYYIAQNRADYVYPLYRIYGDWYTYTLEPGVHTLEFYIDGKTISQSYYNGSYIIASLLIGNPQTWQIISEQQDVFVTQSYNYSDFDAPLNTLIGISYTSQNIDSTGGPEFFQVVCEFDIQDPTYLAFTLYIIDESQLEILQAPYYATYIDSSGTWVLAFNVSGYALQDFGNKIYVASIEISQNWEDIWFIHIYDEFQTSEFASYEPLLTYAITDFATDSDSSGKYDVLTVEITFNSKIQTIVELFYAPVLYSLPNERLAYYDPYYYWYEYIDLYPGETSYEIYVELETIGARGLDGPFLIPVIAITDIEYGYEITDHYVTQAYDANTFDTPVAYFHKYLGYQEIIEEDGGIEIHLEIIATETITVKIFLELEDSSGGFSFYSYISSNITLSPGSNDVALLLGYDVLFDFKYQGDIIISYASIDTLDHQFIDTVEFLGVIENVDYFVFEAFFDAYFLDYYDITLIDNDTDPLYEGINFTFQVKVHTPGLYIFYVALYAVDGMNVDLSRLEVTFDTAGIRNITVFIDAETIVRTLISSNGEAIISPSLYNSITEWSDDYETNVITLDLEDFDYQLPVLYSTINAVNTIDNNDDGLFDEILITLELNVTVGGAYEFLFRLSSHPEGQTSTLDSFVISVSSDIYTAGLNELTLVLESSELIYTATWLEYMDTNMFDIYLDFIEVTDNKGVYYQITDALIGTFDITNFDLTPPIEITNVIIEAKSYELVIEVEMYCSRVVDRILIDFTLGMEYIINGEQYYNFYGRATYYSPSLGEQAFVFHLNYNDLFADEIPDVVTLEVFVTIYSENFVTLDDYYDQETILINTQENTTTETTTKTTTSTKEGNFDFAIVIFTFISIAIIPLKILQKRRK